MLDIARPASGSTTGRRSTSMMRLEIGIARPAADHDAPLDAAVPDADRHFPIWFGRKDARQSGHLHDDVLRALLDEARPSRPADPP